MRIWLRARSPCPPGGTPLIPARNQIRHKERDNTRKVSNITLISSRTKKPTATPGSNGSVSMWNRIIFIKFNLHTMQANNYYQRLSNCTCYMPIATNEKAFTKINRKACHRKQHCNFMNRSFLSWHLWTGWQNNRENPSRSSRSPGRKVNPETWGVLPSQARSPIS
jgi:hypothetical protein